MKPSISEHCSPLFDEYYKVNKVVEISRDDMNSFLFEPQSASFPTIFKSFCSKLWLQFNDALISLFIESRAVFFQIDFNVVDWKSVGWQIPFRFM